jgi:hypothetical protein
VWSVPETALRNPNGEGGPAGANPFRAPFLIRFRTVADARDVELLLREIFFLQLTIGFRGMLAETGAPLQQGR